jgi:glycosyltransferase involved in cell wall biosynthesis
LGETIALLFPVDRREPFHPVMIEMMANGRPVIGFRRGAVPEVIDEGATGFLVDSVDDALMALPRALALDRKRLRFRFEQRFSVERMARNYVAFYEDVLSSATGNTLVRASTMDQPARDAA